MKTKLFLLFLIFISSRIFGQLQVNAGNDTIFCHNDFGTGSFVIGGNPTASGGVEPYAYTWSVNDFNSLGASHFLDDSTKANPKIVDNLFEFLKFRLKVTDSTGNQAEDCVNIRISMILMTMIYFTKTIDQGDTIELSHNYFSGGIEPLRYSWYPNYNISDTSLSHPKAWPDTTVIYHVFATDSIGCESPIDQYNVNVNPVGIYSTEKVKYHSMVFPNPVNNNSVINCNNQKYNKLIIRIFNANGQLILIDKFSTNSYRLGDKVTRSGFYIYSISNGSEILTKGHFVKE